MPDHLIELGTRIDAISARLFTLKQAYTKAEEKRLRTDTVALSKFLLEFRKASIASTN